MKDTKTLAKFLVWFTIITTLLGYAVYLKLGGSVTTSSGPLLAEDEAVESGQIDKYTSYVDINPYEWSKEVSLGVGRAKNISWGTREDYVPFSVEVNGGTKNGGFEYSVPPRRDWDRLNWKPPRINDIVTVRFKLGSGLSKARVYYTIRPGHIKSAQ